MVKSHSLLTAESPSERAARWNREHPVRRREIQAAYRERHPISAETPEQRKKRLARKARHRQRHRAVLAEKQTRRYHADPERHRAAASRYAKEHREERRQYHKGWRDRNVEHVRAYARERARLRKYGVTAEALEYVEIILGDLCVYCGGRVTSVDHIVPLAAEGSNDWENFAPACGSCNSGKKDRSLLVFLLTREVALVTDR
jgi:5-methylcytosine-specific restriction endonuclease McrA